MNISETSIRNPVFAWMLMAALMLFGWIGFSRMGVSLNPDVDFPVVSVGLQWEGASPETMETEVVDIVEDAVTTVQGVKEINSSSRQGQATVTVEMELGRDIDVAVQEGDSEDRYAQIRTRTQCIPSENAQAARIRRHRRVDGNLHRKIGNGSLVDHGPDPILRCSWTPIRLGGDHVRPGGLLLCTRPLPGVMLTGVSHVWTSPGSAFLAFGRPIQDISLS